MWQSLLYVVCGGVSAMSLLAMMWLTFFDVMGRKFLDHSITGSLELTEMLLVLVIFASLPLVSLRREHVVFSTFDRWIAPAVQRWQRAVVLTLCGAGLLILGYVMWQAGVEIGEAGETSAQLLIPRAPFVQAMGLCAVLAGVVELVLAWLLVVGRMDASEGHHV